MKPSDYDGRVPEPPYPTLADDNAMLVEDNQRLRQEVEQLRAENETLHHEISFFESLTDAAEDYPHRDRGHRDWLQIQLQQLTACRALLREACEAWEGFWGTADNCLAFYKWTRSNKWHEAARVDLLLKTSE